ncbi:MAG: hypothetical protein LBP27_03865, partial [Treponema sp.]|nr:hypothetical protein [Treponema sp.]
RETLERLPPDDSADCEAGTAGNGLRAIVPVPPRPGKIKKTGWDQIEYLAALLEKPPAEKGSRKKRPEPGAGDANLRAGSRLSLPVRRCLKRLPSKSQKELNREDRGTNLKGRVIPGAAAPETAVLVDDVITTGSTMDACAEALKSGGAKKVYGICLFYD